MKDLDPTRKMLGMELISNMKNGALFLSQESYITKVLEKFRMINNKVAQIPLAAHFRLSSQQCPTIEHEQSEMTKVTYASTVGCLISVTVLTRPNIA